MKYTVVISEKAKKQFKKMDKHISSLILGWLTKNIQNCKDPRVHGKGLVGDKSGQWRYRVGDYRLLCKINDDQVIVLILEVGHRREIYN